MILFTSTLDEGGAFAMHYNTHLEHQSSGESSNMSPVGAKCHISLHSTQEPDRATLTQSAWQALALGMSLLLHMIITILNVKP